MAKGVNKEVSNVGMKTGHVVTSLYKKSLDLRQIIAEINKGQMV